MKLNKILMALSAMAIVGCSSEDFNDPSVAQAIDDSRLIQLDDNFVLAGVGEVDNTMRTHWELVDGSLVNKFLPIWALAGGADQKIYDKEADQLNADLTAQAVGLCWLGNGAAGTDVYTNYEFYHFGWLNKEATKAEFDCGTLTNGSLYNEIKLKDAVTVGAEAVPGTDWVAAGLLDKSKKDGNDNLNYNSGVYKTDNKAIFGGDYIVYYPFNPNFKDAGTIPAVAKTNWTDVSTDFNTKELGHATFRYSAPVTIEGGNQAADFGLYNLSALVQLKVFAPEGDAAIDRKVDQIVLYSASEKLLKQANLAADKIAAGQKGADLYASTEGTKTISAKFKAGQEVVLKKKAEAAKGAFITVLPTTVSDLVVLVHSTDGAGDDGKWATIDKANTEFKAGSAKVLELSVTAADLKADYIAVDEASLTAALTDARAAVTADATATPTITVIGDIKLSGAYAINDANDANITIKGDDIIVPENVTLTLNTNMESDIRVLGKSCCTGDAGGILNIAGGTISNVTMEKTEATKPDANDNPTLNYNGAATVAAGKTIDVQAGDVIVNKAVAHKGNIKIAEGATVTVNGDDGGLQFMGSTVENNGTIEVKANGDFDMTDANGNATADDGKRMTNNGTFIHNVDAGVGTAVQSMKQNGEYRCRVNDQIKLDDAFLQWTACSVIEMVNAGAKSYNLGTAASIATPYQHNGKYIDIEVNSGALTTFNQPLDDGNGDGEKIQIGNLTVVAGGLDIVYGVAAGKTGPRELTVNGDMTVAAATTLTSSKKINVTGNLTLNKAGVTLLYKGAKKNEKGLAVTKDIVLNGDKATTIFDASEADALNITCANFTLTKGTAKFGNRSDGAAKNMVVSGTIDNTSNGVFNILPANTTPGYVLAWVSCKELKAAGEFPNSKPRVE